MLTIIAIVGRSDSGKTTLITKLLPELKRRGLRVGVAKHCPHGFDLDRPGKDSWNFSQAGADGIFLISPGQIGLIREFDQSTPLDLLLERYFSGFDLVILEGLGREGGVRKVEMVRRGVSEGLESAPEELVACVTDMELKAPCPVFRPDEIEAIASFLEDLTKAEIGTEIESRNKKRSRGQRQ